MCSSRTDCPYYYIFETPSCEDFKLLSKYPSVPHPFIIEPPLDEKTDYAGGEGFDFRLLLIGKAIDYFPYFIHIFQEIGRIGIGRHREGKYVLETIINHNLFYSRPLIVYDRKENILKPPTHIIKINHLKELIDKLGNIERVTFNFLTPTRIKYEDKLLDYLDFHIFIRNFLRRLSALYYFHCSEELALDYKGLVDKAMSVNTVKSNLKWYDWERVSSRKGRMKLGGFRGDVIFEGNLSEFIIFILLGKYLHAGKAAGFGMGKYDISLG
jgi:hypothetical protein